VIAFLKPAMKPRYIIPIALLLTVLLSAHPAALREIPDRLPDEAF
jgi:hypothetical protein